MLEKARKLSGRNRRRNRPAEVRSGPMGSEGKRDGGAAAEAEAIRLRRLREDARRPMAVNLTETIALSHALIKTAADSKRR